MSVIRLGWSSQMTPEQQREWVDEARGILDAHRVKTPGAPKRTTGPIGQAALALEDAARQAELAVRTIERQLAHLEVCLRRVETNRAALDALHVRPSPGGTLGEALRREREALGLSQRDAARLSGVSRGYLSRLEGGPRVALAGPEGEAVRRAREKIAAALAAYAAQTAEEPQP